MRSMLSDVPGVYCALSIFQKEQVTLGSGRIGLRNVGNTVSVDAWWIPLKCYSAARLAWIHSWNIILTFCLYSVSDSVFPERSRPVFVSHTGPQGLLPPQVPQAREVLQRGCGAHGGCVPVSSCSLLIFLLSCNIYFLSPSHHSLSSSFLWVAVRPLGCKWRRHSRKSTTVLQYFQRSGALFQWIQVRMLMFSQG